MTVISLCPNDWKDSFLYSSPALFSFLGSPLMHLIQLFLIFPRKCHCSLFTQGHFIPYIHSWSWLQRVKNYTLMFTTWSINMDSLWELLQLFPPFQPSALMFKAANVYWRSGYCCWIYSILRQNAGDSERSESKATIRKCSSFTPKTIFFYILWLHSSTACCFK